MRKLGMEQRTEAAEDVIRLSVRRTVGNAVNGPPQPIQTNRKTYMYILILPYRDIWLYIPQQRRSNSFDYSFGS